MSAVPILDPLAPSPGFDPGPYLREEYADAGQAGRATSVYYRVKPLVPRSAQLAMRRLYARRQARREFPRWPIEPLLVEHFERRLLGELSERGGESFEAVWLWPHGHRCAITLTHDVEGTAGVQNLDRVLEVERRHGFVSSWNFCGDWYPIPDGTFARVRDAGCEVGLHGITHDDRMWRDHAAFEEHLPAVRRYLQEWGSEGFRSPATHRNAAWMPELGASYDSSFPDTDPFEPKAGGCCSIWPFFLGDMVELPITMVQDHTLWEVLQRPDNELWAQKSRWVADHYGLINVIVHPDYVVEDERLGRYEALLEQLAAIDGAWRALPCDVASWWRTRAQQGSEAPGAVLVTVAEQDGRVRFDHEEAADVGTR